MNSWRLIASNGAQSMTTHVMCCPRLRTEHSMARSWHDKPLRRFQRQQIKFLSSQLQLQKQWAETPNDDIGGKIITRNLQWQTIMLLVITYGMTQYTKYDSHDRNKTSLFLFHPSKQNFFAYTCIMMHIIDYNSQQFDTIECLDHTICNSGGYNRASVHRKVEPIESYLLSVWQPAFDIYGISYLNDLRFIQSCLLSD